MGVAKEHNAGIHQHYDIRLMLSELKMRRNLQKEKHEENQEFGKCSYPTFPVFG